MKSISKTNKLAVWLFLVFILISSCKEGDVKEKNYSTGIDNVKENLFKDKITLFEAYEDTSKILRDATNDQATNAKATQFINDIINSMDEKSKTFYNEKKYSEALNYALSLKSIGYESELKLKDIYQNYLSEIDNSSDTFTKNGIKEEMANENLLTTSELYGFIKYYYDKKSIGFYNYYLAKYSKLYPTLLSEYPELIKYKEELNKYSNLNMEDLMQSVVTVILNKGMNVKDGMGYFDKSIGTGFFIDDNGYILTNHHVIADDVDPKYKGYSAVYVTTREDPDTEIPAKVIGYDKVFDIALLKIQKKGTKPLILGRSDDIKVGDRIFTIGNPIGIKYTVTSGIISNKEIDFFQLGRAFQIDAAVNPGNSGGPLFDERGQVIGVVFAGVPQYQNINFAIPFQWIIKTIPLLYKGGEVKRCWVGGGLYNNKNRIEFYYVMPNSNLSKSGIKVGDLLNKIESSEMVNVEDAQYNLAWQRYPRLINLSIESNGKTLEKIVKLDERPFLPIETAFEKDTQGKLITLVYGIELNYYDKNPFLKKYTINKIYKRMLGSQVEIGEGDPVVVYDLKYLEKDKIILLTIKFKKKDMGFIDRIVTIPAYAEINSIF